MFDYEGEKDHEGFVERVIVVIMIWKGKEYNTLDGSGMINVLLKRSSIKYIGGKASLWKKRWVKWKVVFGSIFLYKKDGGKGWLVHSGSAKEIDF